MGSLFLVFVSNKQWFRNRRTGLLYLNAAIKAYYGANRAERWPEARCSSSVAIAVDVGLIIQCSAVDSLLSRFPCSARDT